MKAEVNAKGDGKVFVYDENGNLISKTDEDGYVTEYEYSPVDLVNAVNYNDTKSATYLYNGTGGLIEMEDWNGKTSFSRDLLKRITSIERDDLMIYAEGNGQLDYVQREVYVGSERIEQFTDRSNSGYERTLYVHEGVQGNTRYHTKTNGNSFAELTYDAWGMPVSPNKLLNNDQVAAGTKNATIYKPTFCFYVFYKYVFFPFYRNFCIYNNDSNVV